VSARGLASAACLRWLDATKRHPDQRVERIGEMI
jgi:hypothetical protein